MKMPEIFDTSSIITRQDEWDHFSARIGYRRMYHRVRPGLYTLGKPGKDSPVFVSANYTLSFDALRSNLKGMDCYVLVLDTKGINVWCAAAKGTFATNELINRIEVTSLKEVVDQRTLILPQLGAAGVSAHEVKKRTGFKVEYGPVRAADITEYMKDHKATEEMRTVRFRARDRALLIPVEIKNWVLYLLLIPIALFLIAGWFTALVAITAIMAGVVLFPLLMPILPTKDFSSKGFVLGALVSLPFIFFLLTEGLNPSWIPAGYSLAIVLIICPAVAYLALNFTGSTPFASRTGVRREIFKYIPVIAGMFITGAALAAILSVGKFMGWF